MDAKPEAPDRSLRVIDLEAGYGAQKVIRGVSLEVGRGKIVSLLGPNGAGKSTLLKAIAGVVHSTAGHTMLGPSDVTNMRTERLASLGVGYVPQLDDVFPTMSVMENLEMGGYLLPRRQLDQRLEAMFSEFPKLSDLRGRRASTLSGGERKTLAIARALMVEHQHLLLDEPTAGLSPSAAEAVLQVVVRRIADRGVGILLVEQRARAALEVSDWGYILVTGVIRATQSAPEMLARPDLGELLIGRYRAENGVEALGGSQSR